MNCGADAGICAAPTQIARHRFVNLGISWCRIFSKKAGCLHDLARLAVAALRNLSVGPSGLYGVQGGGGAEAFDCGNRGPRHVAQQGLAGPHRLPVDLHRAGPARGDATAEFRSGQVQPFAQRPKQRHVGRQIQRLVLAVYDKEDGHGDLRVCDKMGDKCQCVN